VLLIHGNSSCRDVFHYQLEAPFAASYRMIAFDLPGHGQSSDAPDPQRSYTLPGFADAAIEVLNALGVSKAIVFGWSLGGHIAIEMLSRNPGIRALLLSGTPLIGKVNGANDMGRGFNHSALGSIAGKTTWSEKDAQSFIRALFGEAARPFLFEAAMRADGRFRKRLFESSREGEGVDQRLTVESATIPIAVINGAADPLIKPDYFETLSFQHPWDHVQHRLAGLGHVPFWQGADAFNALFARFLSEMDGK
jgi:pimeloyl-ACP methyl ester carboxylesterase